MYGFVFLLNLLSQASALFMQVISFFFPFLQRCGFVPFVHEYLENKYKFDMKDVSASLEAYKAHTIFAYLSHFQST